MTTPEAIDPGVIEAIGLGRHYGRLRPVEAVRDVSFRVPRGTIFGLIGPDGAGKTSIIQMLAGVLRPHRGVARVAGFDAARSAERIRERVGYMPQGLGSNLYDSLTVRENIEFFRDLRRLPDAVYQPNRAELLAATRLAPFLERRAGELSGGMRQKLALICTLIHLPDVLLLDEPTTGVDPISRQDFWQILGRVVEERQATVLVSTSYMDEAARCHAVALLHAGSIIAEGPPETIRGLARGHFVRLVARPQALALDALRACGEVRGTEIFGDAIHVQFDGSLERLASLLRAGGVTVETLTPQAPGLEDVFLQLLPQGERAPATVRFESREAAPRDASVRCRAVSRRFGAFTAVDRIDLSVNRGEILGLLGPNGAGKTTLIKMMCGLVAPSAGTIEIGGAPAGADRTASARTLGYMSQRFSLYQDLTVAQNLRLYADLYDLEPSSYGHLVAALGLEPVASRLTKDLPAGVRQRLSLLCAVLHHPSIVCLDEPTSGVDPQARRAFWELIHSLSRDGGVTVLVSTHYMDEAAHCDRLGLMHHGRLVAEGSPAELKARSERRSGALLAIHVPDIRRAHDVIRRVRPGASLFGDEIRLRTPAIDADRAELAGLLERHGIAGASLGAIPLSMDDAFIDFVEAAEAAHA